MHLISFISNIIKICYSLAPPSRFFNIYCIYFTLRFILCYGHRSQPHDLRVATYVIDSAGHCDICPCPEYSNSAKDQSAHRLFHKAEDVFNKAACLRLFTILLFLLIRKWMISVSLLTNDRLHPVPLHNGLLSFVAGIQIQFFALVALIKQWLIAFGVMNVGGGCIILQYHLVPLIRLGMHLRSVELLASFLRPAGINVLVALLVGLVIPQLAPATFLDCLVLFACVALTRSHNETRINNPTFVELEPHFVKAGAEVIEKLVVDFTPCQHLFVVPDGFLVGNISHITDAKEVTKTGAVDNLILYLMVAQTVVTLKK